MDTEATKVDFTFKRRSLGNLTSHDVDVLNTKQRSLQDLMNKILELMCEKNTIKPSEIAKKILTEMGASLNQNFCMGRNVASVGGSNECDNLPKMFDQQKLEKMILGLVNKYNSKQWIHLVCKYDKETKQPTGHLPASIIIEGGGGNSFIDLRNLLIEDTKEESPFVCVQVNDKMVCSHNKPSTSRRCDFCDKWTRDREMFKQLIYEMLAQNQIINIIELMKDNLHLFPAAILDQERYHIFHTSLEEYKKRIR